MNTDTETAGVEAPVAADAKVTVGADPANPIVMPLEPVGMRGVCLIIKTLPAVGMQIDMSLENDTGDGRSLFNPKDPAHVLAWYVQQNSRNLIAHAAVALMETAKAEALASADVQGQSAAGFARAAANAEAYVEKTVDVGMIVGAADAGEQVSDSELVHPPKLRLVESGRHDIELADSEGGEL